MEFNLSGMSQPELESFLGEMHSAPSFLAEPGDAMRFFHKVDQWTTCLHSHLPEAATGKLWQTACIHFANNSNWMCLYFADADLFSLYKRRGDILEASLRALRYPIDYRFGPRRKGRKRIKVGILNKHFAEGTETRATLPVFAHLDPDRFEVILYALHLTGLASERHCESRAARLVELPETTSAQVPFLRGEDLDILFYGANLTAVLSPQVLLALHRLARVQITSFCSPVTTGLRHMDYFIAGTLTESAGDPQERYRERLIRLEGSGICFDPAGSPPASGFRITREDLRIPRDACVFVSGANFFKIIPELRECWVRILAQVPDSFLVLYPFGPAWSASYPVHEFKRGWSKACAGAGVRYSRVKMLNPLPSPADLQAVLKLADIYLDSFPYSGATSLLDPLKAALPPVALNGGVLRFSQAAALLRELGLPELVSGGAESYQELAVSLAGDAARRRSLSERIAARMTPTPPFLDSKAHCARVGELFEELSAR